LYQLEEFEKHTEELDIETCVIVEEIDG